MNNAHWPPIYDARRLPTPLYEIVSREQALAVVFSAPPGPVDVTAYEQALSIVLGGSHHAASRAQSLTVAIGGAEQYAAARAHSLTVVFAP